MKTEEREREERYRAIKFLAIIAITAMMAIPIIQHIQNEYASTPVESYSYYNEMVRFVGSNAFIGFDGNLFPVSWNVFEANPNYSPGPQANPFSISTNNTNTSAPLIEETFSNYTTKRIESVWQNSAVMIKWNHYVKIAEIFSFTSDGIDASIVVKNLNVTNTYISTFSLGMGINSTMAVNGFNPSCQNISSGTGIIPSNDWNVSVGNISVNWQSEDSIFHSGVVSQSASGDQIILPFETGVINHNQSYTIDPMIYYRPSPIFWRPPPPPPPLQYFYVSFDENGLKSGTSWSVTVNGFTKSSTSSSIAFMEQNHGSYSYSISPVSDYRGPNPQRGSVYINGASQTITVTYTSASPPSLGYMYVGCYKPDLHSNYTTNLSQAISNYEPTIVGTYFMIGGGCSKLNFTVPYTNANSGNSNWGITLYIDNNGAWDQIYSTTNINGNGILHYSWTTKPGIYDGFEVVFTNEYGTTTSVYNEQFDVYSGLVSVSTPSSNNPCLSDSSAVSYYNSDGNVIGYLLLTATSLGNQVNVVGSRIGLGLQMTFISIADNVSANKFKYGIFNYEQSLNYSGSQNGCTPSTCVEPINSASQMSSTTGSVSNTNCTLAEESVYDLITSGLLLSDYGIGIGLAMAALGPFLFQSQKGGSSSYWEDNGVCGNAYTFYNWIDTSNQKNPPNKPPQIKVYVGRAVNDGCCNPICPPVYTVVNNGNGNPSYMQNLHIKLTIGQTGLKSGQQALFWYIYSARATIVPISHCYISNTGNSLSKAFNFNQNDYVNATWHSTSIWDEPWTYGSGCFEYNGPSYNGAEPELNIYFGEVNPIES